MKLIDRVINEAEKILKIRSENSLENLLRLLGKWRSVLIQNTLVTRSGTTVLQGPFKGLNFSNQSAEGCHIAKLLGTYEQPLQPFIDMVIQNKYDTIIDIGCAEGYYVAGFALRCPKTRIIACDTNPKAQVACAEIASKNSVLDRVTVRGTFEHNDFNQYYNTNTLVFCDIEGAELELLDVSLAPALKTLNIIVESHECLRPGITRSLIQRFSETHDITVVRDNGQRVLLNPPDWFVQIAHLDQLLAVWEWRSGPTPWLVMNAKRLN